MAQPRRIQLTSLPGDGPLPVPSAPTQPIVKEPTPETLFVESAVRFELQLFPSDEHRCPEFYYPDLVKANEARKHPKTLEEVDADNEMNELEALARKFEAKYGGPDKPRKDRISDLVDMGDGYDEEDSFIDNSEAYDEFVPSSLNTEHGGFYINCGALKFCRASCSDGDPDTPKMAKKRKLKDGEPKLKKKKKSLEPGGSDAGTAATMQESALSHDAPAAPEPSSSSLVARPPPQKKTKRPPSGTLSLDSVLRRLQQEKLQEFQPDKPLTAPPPTRLTPTPLSPTPLEPFNTPSHSALPTGPVVLTNQNGPAAKGLANPSPPAASVVDPAVSGPSNPQLATPPRGLPTPLRASIRDLTQAAKTQGGNKIKFFTQAVNDKLLDVEVRSRELGPAVRSHVFTHLSTHLPFTKDTLLKRARKLTMTPVTSGLPEVLQKLKEAITTAMQEQLVRYQSDRRSSSTANPGSPEGQQRGAGGEEEEEEGEVTVVKGPVSPPKRFCWTQPIRALLCDVVQMKLTSYEQEKKQSPDAEKYLKNFLELEVKPLWPKGWMLTRILLKESRKAHVHLTSMSGKMKSEINAKIKKPKEKVVNKASVVNTTPAVAAVSPTVVSSSLGNVCQELGALSASMTQHIQELHNYAGRGRPPAASSSTQLGEPALGMPCPDPSLVLRPVEHKQPLGPSPSPPPGQAAESEGGSAQTWPCSGSASFGSLQAALPPASLPLAANGTPKDVN
ncbi:ubinuclein-1-like [Engraulis encrasicolus]|uniref:ubinuclein-1-like n=1 Tax=Engraulis encrasicolus TaxID=184585 RepID=UPI002FCE705E